MALSKSLEDDQPPKLLKKDGSDMAGSMYQTEDDSNVISGRRTARRSVTPVLFRLPNLRFDRAHVSDTPTNQSGASQPRPENTASNSSFSGAKADVANATTTANLSATINVSRSDTPGTDLVQPNAAAKAGYQSSKIEPELAPRSASPLVVASTANPSATNPSPAAAIQTTTQPVESFWKKWAGRVIVVILAFATLYMWTKLPADRTTDDQMKAEGIAESDLTPQFEVPASSELTAIPSSIHASGQALEPSVSASAIEVEKPQADGGLLLNDANAGAMASTLESKAGFDLEANPFPSSIPGTAEPSSPASVPEMPKLIADDEPQPLQNTIDLNSQVDASDPSLVGSDSQAMNGSASTLVSTLPNSPSPSLEREQGNSNSASQQSTLIETQASDFSITELVQAYANARSANGTPLAGSTYPPMKNESSSLRLPQDTTMSAQIHPVSPTGRLVSGPYGSNVAPAIPGYSLPTGNQSPGMPSNANASSSMPMMQGEGQPRMSPYQPAFPQGIDPNLNPMMRSQPAYVPASPNYIQQPSTNQWPSSNQPPANQLPANQQPGNSGYYQNYPTISTPLGIPN